MRARFGYVLVAAALTKTHVTHFSSLQQISRQPAADGDVPFILMLA